ncbi:TPA: hypothetical protein NJZ22_004488 [Vibrio parahaemolyticus]|nr:hypothetical protein [Vibrio parahaemolyticus]HCG5239220.1 hypothetical protein [Vibrio parahaemolyticus]
MFEEINQAEDWANIKTNVGNAAHIPDALLSLLSDDSEEVEKAYWKIENYVVLQGELSESARYLPQYLEVAVLNAKYKGSVIELLFQIGNGVSSNKELEEDCYHKVIAVFKRVIVSENIVGTKWEVVIKEELQALYNERT